MITSTDYLRMLEPWVRSARADLYVPPGRDDLTCYGTGFNSWGVQTNQKALAAFAVLACHPQTDEQRTNMSRDELLDIALRLFRFCLESHIEGSSHCTDGESWGHTWISILGTERMMHGVEALAEHLTAKDRDLLRRVFVSEADWLLDHYPIVAGTVQNNKPESNLWNGAFLHRVAAMYPDCKRIEEYREKGSAFLINSISVASDAHSEVIVDGRPVRERFVGDNFFESYGCNHHGYLNVGYMVICLSNTAIYHFACKANGWQAPEALYHHVADLWELVRHCFFADGRLLRIGGDTRVRYCYCQDYAIPTWLLVNDLGIEDCGAYEQGWLELLRCEAMANSDDAFLSTRCADLRAGSPLYFTRLEADRAVTLSMGAHWRRVFSDWLDAAQADGDTAAPGHDGKGVSAGVEPLPFEWSDEYHGACMVRGKNRVASWVWRAAEKPTGLCLPTGDSSLAEWYQNCAGEIAGMGLVNGYEIEGFDKVMFPGGFLTWGKLLAFTNDLIGEGEKGGHLAEQNIVFAALPDDRTVVVMQFCRALRRIFLRSRKGLLLMVPNDIFNESRRVYFAENGARTVRGADSSRNVVLLQSDWVNIDDRLGVVKAYGQEDLVVHRPGHRQIGLAGAKRWKVGGMLYADEVCIGCDIETRAWSEGSVVLDLGCVLLSGVTQDETRQACNARQKQIVGVSGGDTIRHVWTEGADGHSYLVCANVGAAEAEASISLPKGMVASPLPADGGEVAGPGDQRLVLPAATARVWQLRGC